MRQLKFALALPVLMSCVPAMAASLTAVKPLQGYTCMMIEETPEQSMDFKNPVSFKMEPSNSAPNVAPAGMQVAIRDQGRKSNGYVETVDFALRPRWISAKYLAADHIKT